MVYSDCKRMRFKNVALLVIHVLNSHIVFEKYDKEYFAVINVLVTLH